MDVASTFPVSILSVNFRNERMRNFALIVQSVYSDNDLSQLIECLGRICGCHFVQFVLVCYSLTCLLLTLHLLVPLKECEECFHTLITFLHCRISGDIYNSGCNSLLEVISLAWQNFISFLHVSGTR